MKFAATLSALALVVLMFAVAHAQVTDCDPDSDGQPTCTTANAGQTYRNFWDPVHYWLCPQGGGAATSVLCAPATLYDQATAQCISWNDWVWTPPCNTTTN